MNGNMIEVVSNIIFYHFCYGVDIIITALYYTQLTSFWKVGKQVKIINSENYLNNINPVVIIN